MSNNLKTTTRALRLMLGAGVGLCIATAAQAADLPYKAAPAPSGPELTAWIEGGWFSRGGDPLYASWGGLLLPDFMKFEPDPGWGGGAGFDHHIAASPWHVSGQFYYTESKAETKSQSQALPLPVLFGGAVPIFTTTAAGFVAVPVIVGTPSLVESADGSGKDKHWTGDIALGYELAHGLQVKLGARVAEIVANTTTTSRFLVSGFPFALTTVSEAESRTFGVGPRAGLDGGARFGAWAFDYGGGVSLLMASRKFDEQFTTTLTGPGVNFSTFSTFATSDLTGDHDYQFIYNFDANVAVGYWFTPAIKASVGYRFDGYVAAVLTRDPISSFASNNASVYYHGPFARLTGSF